MDIHPENMDGKCQEKDDLNGKSMDGPVAPQQHPSVVDAAGGGSVELTLLEQLRKRMQSGLTFYLGVELLEARPGFLRAGMELQSFHLAANGYLHAGSVVTLADTACGYGCFASLPAGADNFTTIELKSNFLRTATSGRLHCDAKLMHGGRRTQIWDATVFTPDGKVMALFRCTQMILYREQP
jgi:1,4-dihydroxy-2-naphthoyl-CoA hydrolase